MSNIIKHKYTFPSFEELRGDIEIDSLSKGNALNILLNSAPDPNWIKVNKFAGNSQYIPINILEGLMSRIFVTWHTEVLSYALLANSVGVHVRVSYRDPITGEMRHADGLGAANLQTKKDHAATDFSALNTNAVEIALPKAKTNAIKDAIGDLGRIFGRDLNRRDSADYSELYEQLQPKITPEQVAEINELIQQSGADATKFLIFMKSDSVENIGSYQKAITALKQKGKKQ